ncbi:arginine-tRNA-protein transferase [Mycena maculata]|uniref:Arginyl-tRNA--protein transferase 1 n=1 Tax=Mycena maculata TaxID=230809 RepID=A0AAD7N2D3_9AGAR|nr:arginine-tRNA-protein transferase [Mycena maculata]
MISLGTPCGSNATTCGYCSPPGSRTTTKSAVHAAELLANQLTCQVYQKMIDRGWRRSGTFCYKPDLKASCCPSYTIKLDAVAFKPSKSQRKLINRWNRFILHGKQSGDDNAPKSKSKDSRAFSLIDNIHAAEIAFCSNEDRLHQFETLLEPSSYTPEKYQLFCKYQREIHKDLKSTPSGFKHFLVDSPLAPVPIPYSSSPPPHLPTKYGSYHQLYKCDGKLFALGVIDILPNCVSSVYFMYNPEWEEFSLGKLSALREVSLAAEMQQAGAPDMTSLYMGFYIYSCQKMRYKGDYSPSYLADPETYEWFPLKTCIPLLEKFRYACFSNPDHCSEGPHHSLTNFGEEPPQPRDDVLNKIHLLHGIENNTVTVISVNESPYWNVPEFRTEILACVAGLGTELAMEIIFAMEELLV